MGAGDEGVFSLSDLLARDIKPAPPIIEGFLWEKDNVLIIGHEKAGKSILAMQIAFALTSGMDLFGQYRVLNPKTVLYVQTEGKLPQTIERVNSMMKVNDCDATKLYIAYYPHLALDTQEGMEMFRLDISKQGFIPEVIIIDPLYHAMKGSMIDEESARHMTSNLRTIMEMYGCAIILVHHTHKPIRSSDGKVVHEGDNSVFGSFVWKAWADHTFLFRMDKTKMRVLTCDTQRSGKVCELEELALVDTPYLGFDRAIDSGKTYDVRVRKMLESAGTEGVTRDKLRELIPEAGVSTIDKSLHKLVHMGEAKRDNKVRPAKYWSCMHLSPQSNAQAAAVPT